MSSYIPPSRYENKTHFNTAEFKSALTVDDVDSKLDTKLGSDASSYIDSGTFNNRNGAGSTNVDFNVTYTSAPIVVCTCVNTATSGDRYVHITNTTTTGFSIVISDSASDVNWIAIGSV